jgi:biotin carboxylase
MVFLHQYERNKKMKKKILILGTGVYQTPLIKRAKKMGCEVIVASVPGNYPGFKFADKVCYLDTRNKKAIFEIAKKENIDGITTLGTDVAVKTIGFVCEKLGLPGINEEAGRILTNKKMMKETFKAFNIPTATYKTVYSNEEVKIFYQKLNQPIILKAVDRSGSRGIIKITSEKDIDPAFKYCMKNTDKDYLIVEEFLEGTKIGAEAAIANGKPSFILPNGDILFKGKVDVPIGHYWPLPLNKDIENQIADIVENIAKAMDLDNCGLNLDLMIQNEKVYVIEAAARAGGTNLADLVSAVYDIDYYKYIIDLALGEAKPMHNTALHRAACQVLYSEQSGQLKHIALGEQDPRIIDFKIDYSLGEHVRKFETGPDRIGHLVIKCGDDEQPLEVLENIMREIQIEVE